MRSIKGKRRDSYAAGVKVLVKSLHLAGSAFPFVCMHTAAVSKSVLEELAKEQVEMLLVEPLLPKGSASWCIPSCIAAPLQSSEFKKQLVDAVCCLHDSL